LCARKPGEIDHEKERRKYKLEDVSNHHIRVVLAGNKNIDKLDY